MLFIVGGCGDYGGQSVNLKEMREIVLARCGGYCEKCGKPLPNEGYALHHRKLRSQGGQDAVSNFLALHHKCHNLGTDSVHLNPMISTQKGYIVRGHADPLETLLTLPDGSNVILTEEGTYEYVKEGKDDWRGSYHSNGKSWQRP